jgi:hypothetical protein
VTLNVQVAPAASEVTQPDAAKSPLAATPEIVNVAFPVLVTVIVCATLVVPVVWLPKFKLTLEKPIAGAVALVPIPDKRITCGLPVALSTMTTDPRSAPVAVGVKVTLIVQVAEAATEVQLLVCAKLPLAVMPITVSVAPPLLVRVMVFPALAVLIAWAPKFKSIAERLTVATEPEIPTPDKWISCGLLDPLSVIVRTPTREPLAVGVKVTVMVQLPETATVAQLFVCE